MLNWRDYEWYTTGAGLPLPSTTIIGGYEVDADESSEVTRTTYVGRICHQGELLPAKVIPCKRVAISWHNGEEITSTNFEVLIGTGFKWAVASQSQPQPAGALQVGPHYVGRVKRGNNLLIGLIDPQVGCICAGTQDQKDHFHTTYEVLVEQQIRTRWRFYAVGDTIMEDAVSVGCDKDGDKVYVGRAYHDVDLLPAAVIPKKNVAFVTYNGCQYLKYGVEILCGGFVRWKSRTENIPDNAVVAGHTANGENLFVGKIIFDRGMLCGKIQANRMFIACGGYEIAIQKSYDILIEEEVPN